MSVDVDGLYLEARKEGDQRYTLRSSAIAFANGAKFALSLAAAARQAPAPQPDTSGVPQYLEEACGVCGGRPKACSVLGHRPPGDRTEWRTPAPQPTPAAQPASFCYGCGTIHRPGENTLCNAAAQSLQATPEQPGEPQ